MRARAIPRVGSPELARQRSQFGAKVSPRSHDLVHGVDVWLNNPLPPLEASVNGTPNLSILDGWWSEGYNGANGWAFGGKEMQGDRYTADAQALYALLEENIIPLYYRHSHDRAPREFIKVMKTSLPTIAPAFSARRMLKEYVEQFYVKALGLVASRHAPRRDSHRA